MGTILKRHVQQERARHIDGKKPRLQLFQDFLFASSACSFCLLFCLLFLLVLPVCYFCLIFCLLFLLVLSPCFFCLLFLLAFSAFSFCLLFCLIFLLTFSACFFCFLFLLSLSACFFCFAITVCCESALFSLLLPSFFVHVLSLNVMSRLFCYFICFLWNIFRDFPAQSIIFALRFFGCPVARQARPYFWLSRNAFLWAARFLLLPPAHKGCK